MCIRDRKKKDYSKKTIKKEDTSPSSTSESSSSGSDRNESDSDEKDSDVDEAASPSKRKKFGPAYPGLEVIEPSNALYTDKMSYRFYRLDNRSHAVPRVRRAR